MKVLNLILAKAPNPSVLVLCESNLEIFEAGSYRVVPIWIGAVEAGAIHAAMRKTLTQRPSTHDLLSEIISKLDAYVDHVFIRSVKGSMFCADLTLRQHGRLIAIDARPSDAIALALRQGAEIFMDEDVLRTASYPCIVRNTNAQSLEIAAFHEFLENIEPEDLGTPPIKNE